MTTDDPADREAAALRVACPICDAERGELCEDVVAGCIGPVETQAATTIPVGKMPSGLAVDAGV